ncbi:MAG: hypothetical protein ABH808_03470 [Candidatus Kuenenbacteria bacterium]
MIQPSASLNEQIKKLAEENLEYSKEILKLNKKIYKDIIWKRIYGAIKIIIIIISIIFSVIYLSPILKNFFEQYQKIIQQFTAGQKIEDIKSFQKILNPEQLEEILKKINK